MPAGVYFDLRHIFRLEMFRREDARRGDKFQLRYLYIGNCKHRDMQEYFDGVILFSYEHLLSCYRIILTQVILFDNCRQDTLKHIDMRLMGW